MLHKATVRCARSAHAIFRFPHPGAGCYRVGPVLLPSCNPTPLPPRQKPCKSVRTLRSSRAAKHLLTAELSRRFVLASFSRGDRI